LAGRFLHSVVDLQEPAAIERFVGEVSDAFEQVDVLVNNAGIAREGVLGLVSQEDLDAVIDLNVKGTIWMTRAVVRRMLPRHKGRVINVSSIVGLSGYRGLPVYSASKAALDGFTRALARELGSHGITVNSVAPGYLRTEMSHGLDDRQLAQISRRTPAGRLGEPEDVASAVQFLASEGAAFVSGHMLVVDGGLIA
jgi:3-oxoacyl-[acyl-carrier protein] reductase